MKTKLLQMSLLLVGLSGFTPFAKAACIFEKIDPTTTQRDTLNLISDGDLITADNGDYYAVFNIKTGNAKITKGPSTQSLGQVGVETFFNDKSGLLRWTVEKNLEFLLSCSIQGSLGN